MKNAVLQIGVEKISIATSNTGLGYFIVIIFAIICIYLINSKNKKSTDK